MFSFPTDLFHSSLVRPVTVSNFRKEKLNWTVLNKILIVHSTSFIYKILLSYQAFKCLTLSHRFVEDSYQGYGLCGHTIFILPWSYDFLYFFFTRSLLPTVSLRPSYRY